MERGEGVLFCLLVVSVVLLLLHVVVVDDFRCFFFSGGHRAHVAPSCVGKLWPETPVTAGKARRVDDRCALFVFASLSESFLNLGVRVRKIVMISVLKWACVRVWGALSRTYNQNRFAFVFFCVVQAGFFKEIFCTIRRARRRVGRLVIKVLNGDSLRRERRWRSERDREKQMRLFQEDRWCLSFSWNNDQHTRIKSHRKTP